MTQMLLERGFIGSEATGLSAGTLQNGHTKALGGSNFTAQLEKLSSTMYQELESSGFSCGYVKSGGLVLATTTRGEKALKDIYKRTKALEEVEFLKNQQAVAELEPMVQGGTVRSALHYPQSGFVEPGEAARAFVEAAVASNSANTIIKESEEVIRIQTTGRTGYQVTTRSGLVVDCETLILCPGAWSASVGRLLQLEIPIVPVKGQIWVTDEAVPPTTLKRIVYLVESSIGFQAVRGDPRLSLLPQGVTHDVEHTRYVNHAYGRKLPSGQVLFGGDRLPCRDNTASELYGVDSKHIHPNQEYVYEFLPGLKKYGAEGGWAGPMPFSPDGKPYVGELDDFGYPNLWVITGLGAFGMTKGPALSRIVGSIICCRKRGKDNPTPFEGENRSPEDDKAFVGAVLTAYKPNRSKGIKKQVSL